MRQFKVMKHSAGDYTVTCWISDVLVQYSLTKTAEGHWVLVLVYGAGPDLSAVQFNQKKSALAVLATAGE